MEIEKKLEDVIYVNYQEGPGLEEADIDFGYIHEIEYKLKIYIILSEVLVYFTFLSVSYSFLVILVRVYFRNL